MKTPNARWLTLTAILAVSNTMAASPAPWHPALYLANDGYWTKRIAVRIQNNSAQPASGEQVPVTMASLAGEPVASLRVCRGDGVELLYDLREENGRTKRAGTLAASDQIILPVDCLPHRATNVFVYAGNARAWPVPDYLPSGFANGDFERGDRAPDHWTPLQTDSQHVLTWESAGGRQGSHCVKTVVADGATATWVQWQQTGLPIVPGRTYRLSGWVRTEKVTGQAGWYVHVNGEQPQLLNRTLNAGSGTYDWRQVTTTFTAPASARNATVGTVLHGTGTAWFDDATLAETGGPQRLRVQVGKLETLRLTPDQAAASVTGDWDYAGWAVTRNFSDTPIDPALIHLGLQPALAKLPGVGPESPMAITPNLGAGPVFHLEGTGELLLVARVPARHERRFRILWKAGPAPKSVAPHADANRDALDANYQQLLAHRVNLAPAGSFENGVAVSNWWQQPIPAPGRRFGRSTDARFGRYSLELSVARNPQQQWIGWHSPEIPVKPGATYLFSGYLKAVGLNGSALLHAHWHQRNGKLTAANAFASTQPAVAGDSDWTWSRAFLQAPPDAASIQLHLTMNSAGTLRHDGILFAEVLPAAIVRLETLKHEPAGDFLRIWEVNPLVKVFPDSLPGASTRRVQVELARNEFEPFQLALRSANSQFIRNVRVSVSRLSNEHGGTLPPVKVEQVGFVPIDYPSAYYRADLPNWCRKTPRGHPRTDGWAGWWPDPLPPNRPFDLEPDKTQALWFTVRAPRNGVPGVYRGEVTIQADARQPLRLPLAVKVLPFALPDRTTLKAIFDFRRGPGGWFGPDAIAPGEYRRWLRFIAEHRLGLDRIVPPPKFFYRHGTVTMDAAAFDETARFCFDELGMNVSYTPRFFYQFGWAYRPKKFFGLEPFSPAWTNAFQQAYRLFTTHIRTNGWHDKFVYYISDEPHFQFDYVVDQMQKLCALIHQVDATLPIYSSTWRHCAAWDDALDLWGVGQYGCFPVPEMQRLQRAGKQMWFTCDGQMATDTPYLATERMLPYYCFKYGVRGFEFWGLTWWTANPWKRGWHQYIRQSSEGKNYFWVRYPNGDGYLAYPGQPIGVDGPISTIRLEQVREGLEDYEALALLRRLKTKAHAAGRSTTAADRALALARDCVTIPNAGGLRSTEILPDPNRIPAIRKAVNAAIVGLSR